MNKKRKAAFAKDAGVLALAVFVAACWYLFLWQSDQKAEKSAIYSAVEEKESHLKQAVCIKELSFIRLSERRLQLQWPDRWDPCVEEYRIQRRDMGTQDWVTVGILDSDLTAENQMLSWADTLPGDEIRQYEYRVDVTVADPGKYRAEPGEAIPASNLLLCVDPGHYGGVNTIKTGVAYSEGDFTLQLAEVIVRILETEYGITVRLTRDTDSICIGGLTDGDLDGGQLSLRGEYAQGCDLFLSLHTNANLDDANGYRTEEQPVSINKPILILNEIACKDRQAIRVANEIGSRLAETSYALGIATVEEFQRAADEGEIREWSDAYNDQTDAKGTVCRRTGQNGDYYGLLRGAANVGVPGMIIEHGFHTVPEMRELAAAGELAVSWAKADGEGIAAGFGFEKK